MKLSIIFTSALAAMAVASPAPSKHMVSRKPSSLLDAILDTLTLPTISPTVEDLHQCLSAHKTFQTDFTKAEDGVCSITKVDHTCCEKGKVVWSRFSDGRYGKAVFTEPCDGATVTGLSTAHMKVIKGFFDSI